MGTRYARKTKSLDIPEAHRCILMGEQFPADVDDWDVLHATHPSGKVLREYWQRYRATILEDWTWAPPGTRPAGWWMFDAPRWDAETIPAYERDRFAAPRLIQIDGQWQEPTFPARGWVPLQHCGLWALAPWQAWQGWTAEATECTVESQAAYLVRFGLLSAPEADAIGDTPPDELAMVTAAAYGLTNTTN